MSTCIVIAARNEADNIGPIVRGALYHGDVLVVDNASSDGTMQAAVDADALVLLHEQDTHIKQSFVDGFREVMHDYHHIVQMDAGGSHNPQDIPRLLAALDNADVATTWRTDFVGHPWWRIAMSRLAGWLIRLATGMPYRDPTSGFRAYRAQVLREIDQANGWEFVPARAHAFQFELLAHIWRQRYTVAEVPICYRGSGSSVKLWIVWEALRSLWRLACS